jgi:hypothetical protein
LADFLAAALETGFAATLLGAAGFAASLPTGLLLGAELESGLAPAGLTIGFAPVVLASALAAEGLAGMEEVVGADEDNPSASSNAARPVFLSCGMIGIEGGGGALAELVLAATCLSLTCASALGSALTGLGGNPDPDLERQKKKKLQPTSVRFHIL